MELFTVKHFEDHKFEKCLSAQGKLIEEKCFIKIRPTKVKISEIVYIR